MKRITLSFLFILSIVVNLFSQHTEIGKFYELGFESSGEDNEYHICPTINLDELQSQFLLDLEERTSPLKFANKFELNLNTTNSGIWRENNEYKIWRLTLVSSDAYSIWLALDNVSLPDYTELSFYGTKENEEYGVDFFGPITNNFGNSFGTPLLAGDTVIVELIINKKHSNLNEITTFDISGLHHDFVGIYSSFDEKDGDDRFGLSLDCNIDINCTEGDDWQLEKQSIVRIISDRGLCSGGLLNNTRFDKTPLVLTANHCNIHHPGSHPVFYFNYESPTCNGVDGNSRHIVSGIKQRSLNSFRDTDHDLLMLNARVPTSYKPFYAGWDRTGDNPTSGVVIHHPRGDVKKISFDNDLIQVLDFSLSGTIIDPRVKPGKAWVVSYDEGTTESVSSGAPLFNENHRVVGQLYAGDTGCEVIDYYGRLSSAWDIPGDPFNGLNLWLDPDDEGVEILEGYFPGGWQHSFISHWSDDDAQKVHGHLKSVDIGIGSQVFYRGKDNRLQRYSWTPTNGWSHDWINPSNAPGYQKINGDLVVGAGNQVFYRGHNGLMQTYYWNSTNGWQHGNIGGAGPSGIREVNERAGSIAVTKDNHIFYRTKDNYLAHYFWANNQWNHEWVDLTAETWERVDGDVVVGNSEGHVYYRGPNGQIQTYYKSGGQWNHGWLGNNDNALVHPNPMSLVKNKEGDLFYRGTDNKLHTHYWANNQWNHELVGFQFGNNWRNIDGPLAVANVEKGYIRYQGVDDRVHQYYWSQEEWIHDWVEASLQAPSIHNINGSLDIEEKGNTLYRGTDEKLHIYYFKQSFTREPQFEYASMEDLPLSPTIPYTQSEEALELEVYPNPTDRYINFIVKNNNTNREFSISIIDVTGKVYQQKKIIISETNQYEMTIEDLNRGIYILKLEDSYGNSISRKIVKI